MAAPLVEHLDSLALAFRGAGRILLCCDFDGTLVPIADHPESCSLAPEVREVLVALSQTPRVNVAIVSGRSLADLRGCIGSDDVAYAGNHGLEIDARGGNFRHPAALATRPELEAVIHLLRRDLGPFPGVWVEDKGLSASVHFRLADPAQVPQVMTRIDEAVSQAVETNALVLRAGKSVREVRPSVDWNKGSAVRWLADRLSPAGTPTLTVYLGDDDTDEDAFRSIACTGIGIRIGDRSETVAKYMIPDPTSVHQFLKWFATSIRNGRERQAECSVENLEFSCMPASALRQRC